MAVMLKFNNRRSTFILNSLAAIILTLIVNFSYLISMIVDERERDRETQRQEQQDERERHRPQFLGRLHVSADGYGYLIAEDGLIIPESRQRPTDAPEEQERRLERFRSDSVFVNQAIIYIFNLQDGDLILGTLNRPRNGSNPSLDRPLERNGEEVAPIMYDRPNRNTEFAMQIFFYFCVSLLMFTIMTFRFDANNFTIRRYMMRCTIVMLAMILCYMLAPVIDWGPRSSGITLILRQQPNMMIDWMVIFKCMIILIVAMVYGRIYGMVLYQQRIRVENEHLRTENLQTRYNMLLGQISPHFFFNSLNSLSMLVREQNEEKALAYIDQLSYTFRYIIQNGQNTTTTLAEEIEFARAYGELFKVRYADKLFFDIEIEPEYNQWILPALSLQPLIGNAVKHNTITRKQPLRVSIRTEGSMLVVSNHKAPKLEPEPSTGIGLKNLRSRWQLISGCDIEIVDNDAEFTVRLPLQRPMA